MAQAPLELTRLQVLGHRLAAGELDERRPWNEESVRRAAWAGLQDSVPRAAVLSLHARVAGTAPDAWRDAAFVQLWGPRFSAYVVAQEDRAVFTLGRLSDDPSRRRRAVELADRLEAFLEGRSMSYAEAGRALGVAPNMLRYAAPTGRVLITWDGARRPEVRTVPAPDVDPSAAMLELLRRYLHVLGPGSAAGFGDWAGIRPPRARRVVDALGPELVQVSTPVGDGWILASDEASFRRAAHEPSTSVRLLPSGDAYFLLQGRDRELLVPDASLRPRLWTSRVWPGAVVIAGDIAGTWRRAGRELTIEPWRPLRAQEGGRRGRSGVAAAPRDGPPGPRRMGELTPRGRVGQTPLRVKVRWVTPLGEATLSIS